MKQKLSLSGLIAAAALLVLSGCGPGWFILPPAEGPVGEANRPAIQAIVAQNHIGTNQMWRIYVRATDPEGDIDKVYFYFSQPGDNQSALPFVFYHPVKELNGAFFAFTSLHGGGTQKGPIYASVEIRVEDRAGNISEPTKLDFTLDPFGPEDKFVPPAPFLKDVAYGQIDFPLKDEDTIVGDAGDDKGE